MRISKHLFINFLILWLSTSSFLIVLLLNMTKSPFNLIALKDISIYVIFLFSFFLFYKNYKINKIIALVFSSFIFILIYNFFISPESLFSKIAALRQIFIPFVLMFLGYQFIRSKEEYANVIKFILFVFIFLVFFGFIERFSYIWTFINLDEYFSLKNIPVLPIGYPIMFIEPIYLIQEGIEIDGIVRMVSTFLDPINFGHTLVTLLVIIFYEKNLFRQQFFRYFLLSFFFIALLFTFSKGAILQLLLIFFVLNQNINQLLRVFSIIFMVLLIYIGSLNHAGFLVHFNGFMNVFQHLTLFGNGLATFGNYAVMFGSEDISNGVGDSYWGSIIGQIGLAGFIAWILSFFVVIRNFPHNSYLTRILISQLLLSAISENAFNLLSVFIPMILIGGFYSFHHTIQKENTHA